MANGEKTPITATGFLFRRIVPWALLFGVVYYIFVTGRAVVNQAPKEPVSPLVTTQTAANAKAKVIAKAKVVSDSGVNFRTKPDVESGTVMARLEKGTVLSVIGRPDKKWLKVLTVQGQAGYVAADRAYVQITPVKKKRGS